MSVTSAVYLAGLRVDLASGRLWRNGVEVVVRPKTAAVLGMLVAHAGEVVDKRDLLRAVWPGGFVGESVVSVCVNELRRVLGDDAREPRFIATVHRRGYRLVAEPSFAPPDAARARRLFVGRGEALAVIDGWWQRAQTGQRRIGFVTAPAGVGKTALVDAFLDRVCAPSLPRVGRGQCVEQSGAGEPYLPILQALDGLCRGPGGAGVGAVLRRCAPSWWAQLPGLLDSAGTAALGPRAAGVPPARMLREFALATEELTAARPLVLVLEDLHIADRATVELIEYLARRREAARLLVLGTYRPAELIARGHPLHPVAQDLGVRGLVGRLPLELLSAQEVGVYLAARLAPRTPSARLVAEVHERTEGNALFVVAVTDFLMGHDLLLVDRRDEVRARDRLAALAMPGEVRAMLEQHVDALDDTDRQLVSVAAAVGVEFPTEAVRAGLGQGCPLTAAEVEERCARLARRQAVLLPAGEVEWPDGTPSARYRFVHEMYREVCYARLGPSRRVQVHRGVGDRIAGGYGGRSAEVAGVLAMHFEQGRNYAAAVEQRCAAAATALARSDYQETRQHTRRALGLLDRVPDPVQRSRLELRVRRAEAVARAATWGWRDPKTAATCRRLRDLVVEHANTPTLVAALFGLHSGELRQRAGDTAAAEGSLRRAVAVVAARPARSFHLRATTALARLWHAQRHTEQAHTRLGELYVRFTEGHDTSDLVRARCVLDDLAAGKPVDRP